MSVSAKKRERQTKRRERAIKQAEECCAAIPIKEHSPKPKKLGAAESRRRLYSMVREKLKERGLPFI